VDFTPLDETRPLADGRYDRVRVTHYVWQNVYQSPAPGVLIPCATLIEIYDTYHTVWVPTFTFPAPEYSSTKP